MKLLQVTMVMIIKKNSNKSVLEPRHPKNIRFLPSWAARRRHANRGMLFHARGSFRPSWTSLRSFIVKRSRNSFDPVSRDQGVRPCKWIWRCLSNSIYLFIYISISIYIIYIYRLWWLSWLHELCICINITRIHMMIWHKHTNSLDEMRVIFMSENFGQFGSEKKFINDLPLWIICFL